MPTVPLSVPHPPPRADRRYRVSLIAASALAAVFPAVALIAGGRSPGVIALTLASSLLAVLLVARLTAPLQTLAQGLRDCLSEDAPSAPLFPDRGAGGMLEDLARLTGRLDVIRGRLINRHPTTGLPTREPFLAELARQM